jgi:hypothetical protein
MIALPPGCTVTYSIWIDVKKLDDEIIEWYKLIGGRVKEDRYWNARGKEQVQLYVAYGNSEWCYHHQNGAGGSRLHFHGNDASVASMFLLKFMDIVDNHNLKESQERYDRDHA